MKKKLRTGLYWVILVVFNLALLWGTLEVFFRLYPQKLPLKIQALMLNSPDRLPWMLFLNKNIVVDEYGLWKFLPNSRFEGQWSNDKAVVSGVIDPDFRSVTHTYDSDGFRNPDNDEHYDIILIGDSFLHLGSVNDWQTIQARFGEALREHSHPFSVHTYGIGNYGFIEYYKALKFYALKKQPQYVIVFTFSGNDFTDTIDPHRDTVGGTIKNSIYSGGRKNIFEQTISYQVLKYLFFRPTVERLRFRRHVVNGEQMIVSSLQQELTDVQLQEVRDTIQALVNMCHEHELVLFLVYIPTKEEVYEKYLHRSISSHYTKHKDLLTNLAERNRIPFIDTTVSLTRRVEEGENVFFSYDSHINAAGAEIIGRVTAAHFLSVLQSEERGQ